VPALRVERAAYGSGSGGGKGQWGRRMGMVAVEVGGGGAEREGSGAAPESHPFPLPCVAGTGRGAGGWAAEPELEAEAEAAAVPGSAIALLCSLSSWAGLGRTCPPDDLCKYWALAHILRAERRETWHGLPEPELEALALLSPRGAELG